MAPLDHGPAVKVPPPLIYVVFLALGILANLWYPLRLLPAPLGWALGGLLIAAGVLVGPIWGVRVLRRAGTTIRPDKPSQKLVTSGPFRFSRNPLYLALTLIYAGAAIVADLGWALLLLIPVMLIMGRFVIGRERSRACREFSSDRGWFQIARPRMVRSTASILFDRSRSARLPSAATSSIPIVRASLTVISSCMSKRSARGLSKRSAQRCAPVSVSMSCAFTRMRLAALCTLPSMT